MPFGAYGPVRYDSTGKNCSLDWAWASVLVTRLAIPAPAKVTARTKDFSFIFVSVECALDGAGFESMGERPQAQLLATRGPQPRHAVRLGDQEDDDQRAPDHEHRVRHRGRVQVHADRT